MTSSSSAELPAQGFKRPLGLALSGGGALGAWQIGALCALEEGGLRFDAALGFSAGALNGAAYALGRLALARERWLELDFGLLKLAPRFIPPSIFSDRPLRRMLEYLGGEEQARLGLRCALTVVSAVSDRSRPIYASFQPAGLWDGPLEDHLVASCAIPIVFPRQNLPFRGTALSLFDGGVPCLEPLSFAALAGCPDVVVLEMVRADEVGLRSGGLLEEIAQKAKDTTRLLMSQGVASLRSSGTRVFRLAPSRPLGMSMLDFRPKGLRVALELGLADGRAFLRAPGAVLDGSSQN